MARDSSENTLGAEEEEHENGQNASSEKGEARSTDEDANGSAEEKGQEGPMKHVGFWDPSLSHVRKSVIFLWCRTGV